MKRTVLAGLLLLVAGAASAQPIPAGQKVGLAAYLKGSYVGLKSNLTASADKMPEADYNFKPGSMPEVRTFGQLFAHVAAAQFSICAAAKGAPNPNQGRDLERELKVKSEFTKALSDSFALCDDVFSSLADANVLDFVKQGPGEVTRSAALVGLLAHGVSPHVIP